MYFCASQSKKSNELSIGSAPTHENLLLVECNEPWSDKAIKDSSLPIDVKNYLQEFASIRGNKILLIKGEKRTSEINFIHIKAGIAGASQYRYRIKSYDEILNISLGDNEIYKDNQSLALICTNGKKDKCCSKFGFPFYKSLEKENRNNSNLEIWQCSHFGGDRFAPMLLLTPQCIYYGRMNDLKPSDVISNILNCKIMLENLRGRSIYNGYIQSAEYFIRGHYNFHDYHDITFLSETIFENNVRDIEFIGKNEVKYFASVQKGLYEFSNYLTCSQLEKQQPNKFELLNIKSVML